MAARARNQCPDPNAAAGTGKKKRRGPGCDPTAANVVSLPTAPYVPSPREQAALQRMKERRARTAPSPRLKVDATAELARL
jgi:hypothetical protein